MIALHANAFWNYAEKKHPAWPAIQRVGLAWQPPFILGLGCIQGRGRMGDVRGKGRGVEWDYHWLRSIQVRH